MCTMQCTVDIYILPTSCMLLCMLLSVDTHLLCRSETSLTVALWFHGAAVVASAPLLVFGYPDSAVLPIAKDWGLLMAIAVLSFINQMCLNRGFQLEVAAKASAVNYTQASSLPQ